MLDMFMGTDNVIEKFAEEIKKVSLIKEIFGEWVRSNTTSPYRSFIEGIIEDNNHHLFKITCTIQHLKEHGYQ